MHKFLRSENQLPSQRLTHTLLVSALILIVGIVVSYFTWCSDLSWPYYLSRVCKYVFPSLTPVVATIALISGFKTIEQKKESDERAEYYKQLQWAIDNSLTSDPLIRLQSPSLIRSVLTSREIAEAEEEIAQASRDYADALEAQLRMESANPSNYESRENANLSESKTKENQKFHVFGTVVSLIGLLSAFFILGQLRFVPYSKEYEAKEKSK